MSRPAFVAIGECMIELSELRGDSGRIGAAGDTLNTSIYLSRLNVPVAYLTAVGTDPFSTDMRRAWDEEGVDTSTVLTVPNRLPGLYAIRNDRMGEREFYYWRDESAARRLFDAQGIDEALERVCKTRALYLSGITLSLFSREVRARLSALAERVRCSGGEVIFDPNFRPNRWADVRDARSACDAFAPLVSIALPTYQDEHLVYGDRCERETADRWLNRGVREVAVKLGSKGCFIAEDNGEHVPASAHVIATDTTGAGDAFNAGYLAARYFGLSRVRSADFANNLAARVVRHPGAIIPRHAMLHLPLPSEVHGDGS